MIWLSAVLRQMMRPHAWNAITRFTWTTPVSESTSTSTNCTPLLLPFWKYGLVPMAEPNSTVFDPRRLFEECAQRQQAACTAPVTATVGDAMSQLLGAQVTVTLIAQAVVVINPQTVIPGFTDPLTGGLLLPEPPSITQILVGLSPPSSFRFHLGLPSTIGGSGLGVASGGMVFPVGPVTVLRENGTIGLDMPVSHRIPPMTVDVEVNGQTLTLPTTSPRRGVIRAILPAFTQGMDADVISIATPVGVSQVSGWSAIPLPIDPQPIQIP